VKGQINDELTVHAEAGDAEDFDSKVTELRENVEHHAGEEEGEMFPEVRQALGAVRLRELGAEMRELKQQPGKRDGPGAAAFGVGPEALTGGGDLT
jgi:hypothetical protein